MPSVAGPNPALHLAYALQKRLWRLFRPRTRGVKVMLFNSQGELLLIRNSYGRTDEFVLPGGGIRPFETPERAARREIREELGCPVADLKFLATFSSSAEGKRDTIHLFEAQLLGDPRPDSREIIEAHHFSLDALPPSLSPATKRRLAERLGRADSNGTW